MQALAIDGGRPIRQTPLPPWPHFEPDEIEAAVSVLQSGKVNYWTGEEGRLFEREFADFVGTRHGIAMSNGTVTLEAALHAIGLGPGDEVVTTPRTFVASAGVVVLRGGRPVFADVDPDSQNITADTIRAVLTPRTRAIIAVHLAGWPCDMDPIMALAREHGLTVIEDCAQAHGATYKGRPVGSLGHIGSFSFCQDKILTTAGEGGMITTDDDVIWERIWSYKDHGKSYDAVYNRQHPPGFRWVHASFGTNGRLTEIQSAIGRKILRKLPGWVEARQRNAALLTRFFSGLPALRLTLPLPEIGHSYYKYYVFVRPEQLREGWDRDRIMAAICAEGVPCFSGSCSEIYREEAFNDDLRPRARLAVARELGETSLMFQVHPTLSDSDLADVGRAVDKVLTVATRA